MVILLKCWVIIELFIENNDLQYFGKLLQLFCETLEVFTGSTEAINKQIKSYFSKNKISSEKQSTYLKAVVFVVSILNLSTLTRYPCISSDLLEHSNNSFLRGLIDVSKEQSFF